MPTQEELALEAERDIGRHRAFAPVLVRLGIQWAARRPWDGLTIGLNLHLTPLTAAFVRELLLSGAHVVLSASDPGTTDPGTVHLLRNDGAEVYTGGDMEDRHLQVLSHRPDLLVDAGFDLVAAALDRAPAVPPGSPPGTMSISAKLRGAIVLTKSGSDRLAARGELPFPAIDLHDGRLRYAIENRHDIGEAVWSAAAQLTGITLSGRRAAVVGYGPIGRGLASSARNTGMSVEVVEMDPIRALLAHFDGFPTSNLADVLRHAQVLVTATGRPFAVPVAALENARDGIILLNAGRGGDEVDVGGVRAAAEKVDHIAKEVVRYRLESGNHVVVLGQGHPLNIVANAGATESVLLQFAMTGLTLAWMIANPPPAGRHPAPPELEAEAARHALAAFEGTLR